MAKELDYQDLLDEADDDFDGSWTDDSSSARATARGRDSRRVIEELREARRLRDLLADFDLEDA